VSVRNAEGGTRRAWDARYKWTRWVDVAKGSQTSRKVFVGSHRRTGSDGRTLKWRESSREDEPGLARGQGPVFGEDHEALWKQGSQSGSALTR